MTHRRARRPDGVVRGEQGIAMVTVILVVFISTGLAATMFYTSLHTSTATGRNRCWGAAIHIAESGVNDAIAKLQNTSGVAPSGTLTGTTAEGTYQTVVTPAARNRYRIDSVGICGPGNNSVSATRRLRVTMAPPRSFRYALFSLSDVTTKNNNMVCGDIWANTYVTVYNNDEVLGASDPLCAGANAAGSGSVNAATGYVELQNGSKVAGDVWTGGYDSSGRAVSNGGTIGGNVTSSSSTPGCSDDPGHVKYSVHGGSIGGNVKTWGNVTGGASVAGTVTTLVCASAPTPKAIPTYTFNPANYPSGTVQTFPTPAAFNTYLAANGNALSGTFFVQGGSSTDAIDLTGVKIAGDTTIVAAAAPIDGGNGVGSVAGNTTDKILVLASYYSGAASSCTTNAGNPGDCAISFKNNFQQADNTAVLLYAPNGPVGFKNNADFYGAVYANNIQVKNNMNVIYDNRIESIVGFGDVTLDITEWLECTPGPVTTSSC